MKKIKSFLVFGALFLPLLSFAQDKTVELRVASFTTARGVSLDSATAIKAIQLANRALNSPKFRNEVKRNKFRCENYGERCYTNDFSGEVVLDSIYKNKIYYLNLRVISCKNEYGHSVEDGDYISSCYDVLNDNREDLPIEYIYASHICHEYMHIIGFYHTYTDDDVAEKIGDVAWELLQEWH